MHSADLYGHLTPFTSDILIDSGNPKATFQTEVGVESFYKMAAYIYYSPNFLMYFSTVLKLIALTVLIL